MHPSGYETGVDSGMAPDSSAHGLDERRAMALLAPPRQIRTSAPTAGEARLGRWLAIAAAAGIALAALLGVAAHVNTRPGLSLVSLTISDFAVSDRGGPMDAAMVILGVASG